jgi:hypothetical protein
MANYLLLALNGPVSPDLERTYNEWYETVHVPDLLAIQGVTSARRFKVMQGDIATPFVAAYEIETDDIAAVMTIMEHQPRPFDPSFDRSTSSHILAIAL